MELRFNVDDQFITDLKNDLKGTQAQSVTGTKITQDALALYRWAVKEAASGRVILSTDNEGQNPQKVVMPALIQSGVPR